MKSIFLKLFIINYLLFTSLNCSFQVSFFNEINKNKKGKNLIISPLSIFQILSLTANGARGKTQLEMIEALRNTNIETLNSINYKILETFKEFKTVEIANAVMSKFTPLQEFMKISEKYCAPLERLISANQVNNWCNKKTHGKITKIIDKLDSLTQMILLNAVYFKGTWKIEFKKGSTQKKDFYNLGTEIKQVETMSQMSKFNYYQDTKIQVVQLPYKDDGMSAIIILPRNNVDINEYITSLNSEQNSINELIKKLRISKVNLELPKFELEFYSSLKGVLGDMGIKKAFTNKAELTGLRKENDLKVDDVLHKTYLKVDEFGTEAAAVTAVIIKTKSAMPHKEIVYQMKVNRPFLFLLRSSKLPTDYDLLFMSKIERL